MPRKFLAMMWMTGFASFAAGCQNNKEVFAPPPMRAPVSTETVIVPPHLSGTVGEYARLDAGGECQVQGYGLVVGLGNKGSGQVPPHLLEYFKKYLTQHKVGLKSAGPGLGDVSPERLLRDPDTAVVLLGGTLPPGAPQGTKFDVYCAAMPNTDTKSLEGGGLLGAELRLAAMGMAVPGGSEAIAMAAGEVFVNPFIDANKTADQVKYREGRIIGGGRILVNRPVRLLLFQADYARAQHIQRRLNDRFPSLKTPIATAKNSSVIEVTIPKSMWTDYEHFLQIITHMPLGVGQGALEAHARKIAAAMELPDARHDELALVWEAIGKQILPVVQNMYVSRNPTTAFYAARTGLRLGDESVAGDILIRAAGTTGSPLQLKAIDELGRTAGLIRASDILNRLLDDENEMVRVAAYEALMRRGGSSKITRIDVDGNFTLDVVKSQRKHVIYATESREPRLVLFGDNIVIPRPVFFTLPEGEVTIAAQRDAAKLTVFRKIPRTGRVSDTFFVEPTARALIVTLGNQARPGGEDGLVQGLNFSYSQIVGILHRMCKAGDIDAKFVLQPSAGIRKITQGIGMGAVGRPDAPTTQPE